MKQLLLFTCLLICFQPKAQEDTRYLAGAVPVVNGKVVFTRTIENGQLTKDQLFDLAQDWLEKKAVDENNRLAYISREDGKLAFTGRQYIVFSSTSFALDRTLISYRIIAECHDNRCLLTLNGIRYEYPVSYKDEPEKYTAEEWITDENALHKGKMNRISGKFRRGTIDFADATFDAFAEVVRQAAPQPVLAATAPAATRETAPADPPQTPAVTPDGYISIPPAQIPGTILELLPASTVGLSVPSQPDTAYDGIQWKGTSQMFGKTVAQLSLPEHSAAYKALSDASVFTLSFRKETGNGNAWLLMECRKGGETTDGTIKTIIGEITQVRIK